MSSDITFGPPDQEWHYSKQTQTYDLSSGSAKKLTVRTTAGPENTSIIIDPEATALVIVDMQNFFLDARCMDHPNGLKAVEPIIEAIKTCREVGIQIIWLNWGLTDKDLRTMPAGVQRGFLKDSLLDTHNPLHPYTGLGSDLGSSRGRCLVAGSWNAAVYPPLAQHVLPTDLNCAKNRMSGMWNPKQPLWEVLEGKGIKTLLFSGVNTDQCVLGTLVDAYNGGWNCVMVQDCVGTSTPGGQEATEGSVAYCYGFVIDRKSLAEAKRQT